MECTDPERVGRGHGGRDVRQFVSDHRRTDSSTFRFIPGDKRCSVQSPTHCMDYEMEKNEKGEWIIVSIHP
jgi:hypothetical protein